ncbi:unnamed protein product [Absidia cylindrospora]
MAFKLHLLLLLIAVLLVTIQATPNNVKRGDDPVAPLDSNKMFAPPPKDRVAMLECVVGRLTSILNAKHDVPPISQLLKQSTTQAIAPRQTGAPGPPPPVGYDLQCAFTELVALLNANRPIPPMNQLVTPCRRY